MKRIAGILAIAAFFVGCQKEDTQPNVAALDSKPGIHKAQGACSTFYEDGEKYGCGGSCCDCMESGSVANIDKDAIDEVFSAVEGGDQNTIRSTCQTYQNVLGRYVSPGDVSRVIDGTASARSKPADSEEFRYLIIAAGTSRQVYMIR